MPLRTRIPRRGVAPKRAAVVLGVALLAAGLSIALSRVPGFALAEARVFDLLATVAPPAPSAGDQGIVVVAIDEPSFSQVGLQWPWPRDLHARLVEALRQEGTRAIAMDIVFAEPSANAQADAALGAAMGPDVVLAADESLIETPQMTQLVRTEPAPFLLARNPAVGVASVALDGDGTLRRVPLYPDSLARQMLAASGRPAPLPPEPGVLLRPLGAARTVPTVSYYQALDPERFLPPDFLRGKIAVVGLSLQTAADASAGGNDAFATSFTARTGQLVAGAEIHATIAENLARSLWVVPVGPVPGAAAVVAAALLAGFAALRRFEARALLFALALAVLIPAASFALLQFARLWLPPLAPMLAVAATAVPVAAADLRAERRMRRRVTRAFGQYLAPAMVERLAAEPGALKLGGERRELTLLFSDVRGFTTIAETMRSDPQKLTALINRLLNPLSAVILAHGGTIDKYMGDCVMAFWNAPLADPDHALHACLAGQAMLAAMERLNAELVAENGPDTPRLAVGVGINTGECAVGNMGSDFRFDYTAIGDAVNLASRLEGLSKTYGVSIILGEETARRVGKRLAVREIDRIAVRGRTEATPIFTLEAGKAPATP